MTRTQRTAFAVLLALTAAQSAAAQGRGQPGMGPVAEKCAQDLGNLCPDATHGDRSARTCLEKNKEKVSPECRKALDSTGGGRGRNN